MDWGKIENIIYVAVSGALALFLFIVSICVISKGKHKTGGLDILLRIISSITLIVSAALFVLAVFTGLDGSFCIKAAGDKAVFIAGGKMTELPLGPLFVTLSTAIGQIIAIALFIISLFALIADCILAKKKYGKDARDAAKSARSKTPEERKRDAEIEKIRKIGASAVQKTGTAADRKTNTAADRKTSEADAKEEASQSSAFDSAEQKQTADDDYFDWRVDTPSRDNKEFVGLTNASTADDDFEDSFDEPSADVGATDEYNSDYEEQTVETSDYKEQSADTNEYEEQSVETSDYEEQTVDTDEYEEQTVYTNEYEEQTVHTDKYEDQTIDNNEYSDVYDERDIEPDRDIYIPQIRTIVRSPKPVRPKRTAAKKSEKKPAKKLSSSKPASKSSGKKPTGTRSRKSGRAKQLEVTDATAAAADKRTPTEKPTAKKQESISDAKKLPVTRRYVILDRTNAVNLFSDYLKERDKAEKDKLASSINTIIIK